MTESLKRIVKETIVLSRENPKKEGEFLRVSPEIGKIFTFTREELDQLEGTKDREGVRPQAVAKIDGDTTAEVQEQESAVEPQKTAAKTKPAAGKTASKDDL